MEATQTITMEEVVRAGRTLFGPSFAADAGGWRDALKATYRRRAMETHPDRARSLGRPERDLAREFRAVTEAYRVLSALNGGPPPRAAPRAAAPAPVRTPAPPPRRPSPPPPPPREARRAGGVRAASPTGGPRVRHAVHPDAMPRWRLRLGEYLYYSGRVRWSELVDAIAWQRAQRPPIGRIAVEFGFLRHDDVGVLLERRREVGAHGTPFGEWAVRHGYLTSFQLLAILGHQLRLQRPIGAYFVERGILDEEDIDRARRAILRHNARHR